jgi:hypothetical protein
MNPYIRAVSIYRIHSTKLSFRKYLKNINKIQLNASDKYHSYPQYVMGEEKMNFNYIKIDQNETKIINGITIDLSKYDSVHHGKKTESTEFCGDTPKDKIILPSSYKYFYDDEIKKMVERIYKKDIQFYNYSFDTI